MQGKAGHQKSGERRLVFGTSKRRTGLLAAILSVGLLASGLSGLAALTTTSPAAAAPPEWTCSSFGYLFQTPNATTHQIVQVDLVSGEATQIGTTPHNVNAVGYNTLDNYMYGWDNDTSTVVRIASDGSLTDLGLPSGAPAGVNYQVGDFDDAGHLFLQYGGGGTLEWIEVDLAPGSATYGQLVSSGTATKPANIGNMPSDWAFVNGSFYGLASGTSAAEAQLIGFNATTHETTNLGPVTGASGSTTYGAAYADAAGNLYFGDNNSGVIYRVNPTTGESITLSNGPAAGGNDAARCATAPIPTVTVMKQVDGRAAAADQFAVGLNNTAGTTLTSATTTGTDTSASTTDWPVSQDATYTITDAMAAGSPDSLDAYAATVVCVDGSGATVTTGGDVGAWTLNITAADNYTCTVTNSAKTPSYTVSKTVSAATVAPGGTVTYTVTVTNTGAVPYTADAPASFTDDLSAVLDDATYNSDASNGATVAGSTLSWSGPLAVGATQTVTYSVTVNDPDTGDHSLDNAVGTPPNSGGGCATPGGCKTTTKVQSLTITKTADKTEVVPGETITYTITVVNTGKADYTADAPASFTDELTDVLDDATYNNDATGGATYAAPTLSWSAPLAVGATATITYTVTVNNPDTGDSQLTNAVVSPVPGTNCPPDSDDPSCRVEIPNQSYTVAKSSSTTQVNPGDAVTYTVTVTNTGQVAYTAAKPAGFDDDLSAVLDDATYNGDASNGATYAAPTLSWSGALAVGETVTVTYSVTVNDPDTGDHSLDNAVVAPRPGGGCATAGGCKTTTKVQSFTTTKTADKNEVVPGETITYTITIVNTGQVDYTADAPASFTDDLSAVLDDATYNNDATGGATYAAPTLSWSAPLLVGATATITYTVTVNNPDTGDSVMPNAVVTPPGGNCPPDSNDPDCRFDIPSKSFTVDKSASSSTVDQGGKVTYTVTVTNTGKADYTATDPASFSDDLSAVLDDATYNGDASNGATVTGTTLSWSGALAVGQTITITYSVTVNQTDTGDMVVNNVVRPTSPGGACATPGGCKTSTPVRALEVSKKVDITSTAPGKTVTYTITLTNTGKADYTAADPASLSDDLSAVLDDATYNNDATGGAIYATPVLSWSGPLSVGAVQTVTYTVKVNSPDLGDHVLRNAVSVPGSNCVDGSDDAACSTTTKVNDPNPPRPGVLASTGTGTWLTSTAIAALLAVMAGLGIALIRRRKTAE